MAREGAGFPAGAASEVAESIGSGARTVDSGANVPVRVLATRLGRRSAGTDFGAPVSV